MTVHYPEAFKQARPANFDGIFDWDWLESAFSGKIKPMDIDAIVERKGYFLVFETKAPGVEMPKGQEFMFNRLIKLSPGKITLFIINGKTRETITTLTVWTYNEENGLTKIPFSDIDGDFVWKEANRWFLWADKH